MSRNRHENKKNKKIVNDPTKKEMIACLQRSGYLLEGRLVKSLNVMGLFVEPNQSFLDEKTGVSREIDIIADSLRCNPDIPRVYVKTFLVIEAINNLYPVVLLTPRVWTPNTNFEGYLPCKTTPSESWEDLQIDLYEIEDVHEWSVFSQFCAFTRKKDGELMASHPEDLYTSISKVASYLFLSKDNYHRWMDEIKNDDCWRFFRWKAIVVLQKELYIVHENTEGIASLIKTRHAKLEHNFHYLGELKTIVVDFIVESALSQVVQEILDQDEFIEKNIVQLKNKEK